GGEARQPVLARLRAQQAARLPLAGERAVEAAERLEPELVAQHEHVERDLQPLLRVDLRGGEDGLAGLVVPDDPARRERVDVDAVDLPGDGEPAEVEAAAGRALGAERDLEVARDERQLRLRLGLDELAQVAAQSEVELAALELREVDPDAAGERLVDARVEEAERVREVLRGDALRADRLRQAGV